MILGVKSWKDSKLITGHIFQVVAHPVLGLSYETRVGYAAQS